MSHHPGVLILLRGKKKTQSLGCTGRFNQLLNPDRERYFFMKGAGHIGTEGECGRKKKKKIPLPLPPPASPNSNQEFVSCLCYILHSLLSIRCYFT